MPEISLTINTDEMLPYYDEDGDAVQGARLQDLVIEAAARQLIRSDDFDREVRAAVKDRIAKEVDGQVSELVASVLEEPFDLTTPWGEKTRSGATVRELVREGVEKWLTAKPARDGYGRSEKGALAAVVEEVTRNVMDKELSSEVARVRKEVGVEIRDKALRAAIDAIAPRV